MTTVYLVTITAGEDFNNEVAQAVFASNIYGPLLTWKGEQVAKSMARYKANQGWDMNPDHYDMTVVPFEVR